MKFRKIMLFILTLVLCAGALISCGEKKQALDPKNPTSVVIWHYYNGKQKEAFDALVNQFNQTYGTEKGIVVTAESKGGVDDLAAAVTNSAEKKVGSDELPDLFATYSDTAYILYNKNMLANMKKYMTVEDLADYVPAFIEEGELAKEELYIFPIAKSTELFYLNETDWIPFAEATNTDIAEVNTWEGLAKVAEKYYNWSNGKAFFGRDAAANYMIVGSKQLGKEIFDVQNNTVNMQFDEIAMRRLWDCYAAPYLKGYYGSFGRFRSDDMKTGNLIAFVGSTTSSSYFPTEVTRDDGTTYPIQGKVLALPTFEGIDAYAPQQGAGMSVIRSDALTEQACVEFLKWFTSAQQNTAFCINSGYTPVTYSSNSDENLKKALQAAGIKENSLTYTNALMSTDAIKQVKLYASKPFDGSVAARNVLTKVLTTDLDDIKNSLNGLDAKAIDEQMDTLFAQWLASFKQQLQN